MDEIKENPNYYAIIPANVRYCKNINANEKLLYAEITALCNIKGYCWASNNYFSELYGCTPQAISKWIKNLEDNNYIKRSYVYKNNTKEIQQRNIILCINNDITGINIGLTGINTGTLGINNGLIGYQHTIKDNTNIYNNNISNINNNNINKEKNLEKNIIPTLEEFLDYAENVYSNTLNLDFKLYEFSIISKYTSWVELGWKNGNGKKILNWKTSLKNTIPYLKAINNNYTNGKQNAVLESDEFKDLVKQIRGSGIKY